ncbi:hypothetical protein AKO1_008065 [Acrasis kona]|uniref:Uncharacterized protein n=1 Tax=Acrasis kona TaxID=1008807 RepID=A0AAW2YQ64_9EUKA
MWTSENCSDRDISNMIMMELLDMRNINATHACSSKRPHMQSEPNLSPAKESSSSPRECDDRELSMIIMKQISEKEQAKNKENMKKISNKKRKISEDECSEGTRKEYSFVDNSTSPTCDLSGKEFIFVDCNPTKPISNERIMVQRSSSFAKKRRVHDAYVTHFVLE